MSIKNAAHYKRILKDFAVMNMLLMIIRSSLLGLFIFGNMQLGAMFAMEVEMSTGQKIAQEMIDRHKKLAKNYIIEYETLYNDCSDDEERYGIKQELILWTRALSKTEFMENKLGVEFVESIMANYINEMQQRQKRGKKRDFCYIKNGQEAPENKRFKTEHDPLHSELYYQKRYYKDEK